MACTGTTYCKITATAPGDDTNDTTLFNSQTDMGGVGVLRFSDIRRAIFTADHPANGTLKVYDAPPGKSYELVDTVTMVAPASGASPNIHNIRTAEFTDLKLVWTNGGTAQTGWTPRLTLIAGDVEKGS